MSGVGRGSRARVATTAHRGAWRTAAAAGALAFLAAGTGTPAAGQEITLLAAGDIEWSRATKPNALGPGHRPPPAYTHSPTREVPIAVNGVTEPRAWTTVPFLNRREALDSIAARTGREMVGREMGGPISEIIYPLRFDSKLDELRYPLHRMRDVIRAADVAFANVEMPLTDRGRHTGAFRGDPGFADALRWAGFDVVSAANNHTFDAEVQGLMDTMHHLDRAGVGRIGIGMDLEDARRPHVIEAGGISIAFLGYTWSVNGVGDWGFANHGLPGAMPLDPFLIKEDVRRIRDEVDYVAVSFHWAVENSKETHPDARAFAKEILDAGADIVLGHHPHVPRGVETYDGKVILYSLGNFIFGHGHTYWGDNYVARLTLTPDRITRVEILPIATTGNEMAQPAPLTGNRARVLLEEVQELSALLDTRMEIVGDRGVIEP